jgi:predicted DNA-binding transcriptional regulator AlpA
MTTARKKDDDGDRKILFTQDVARMLGVSKATVERMRYNRTGPKWARVHKKGIVYLEEWILDWLQDQAQGGGRG